MSLILRAPPVDPDVCGHEDADVIGSEGGAQFLRCRGCESIVVFQRGRMWVLGAPRGTAENQDFSF